MAFGTLALAVLLTAPCAFAAAPAKKNKKALAVGDGVIVILKNGSEVKGVYHGDADGAFWIESNGAQVGLERDSIAKITQANTGDAEYRKLKASLTDDDADGWMRLADLAARHGMTSAAKDAAKTAVKIDPEHAGARAFLGYEKIGGKWLEHEAAQTAKGLTLYEGEWVTNAELAKRRETAGGADLSRAMHANDPIIVPPKEQPAPRERKVYRAEAAASSPAPSGGRVEYFGGGGR